MHGETRASAILRGVVVCLSIVAANLAVVLGLYLGGLFELEVRESHYEPPACPELKEEVNRGLYWIMCGGEEP